MRHDLVAVEAFNDHLSLFEAGVRIALLVGRRLGAVARGHLIQIFFVDAVRQPFIFDLDRAHCVFGCRLIDCRYGDDLITGPLDLSARSLDDLDGLDARHLLGCATCRCFVIFAWA